APEKQLGVLVAAVLAPKQRVDGQLEVVRLPAEQLVDTAQLAVGETEGAVKRLGRDGTQGLRNATRRSRSTPHCAAAWASRSASHNRSPAIRPGSWVCQASMAV